MLKKGDARQEHVRPAGDAGERLQSVFQNDPDRGVAENSQGFQPLVKKCGYLCGPEGVTRSLNG